MKFSARSFTKHIIQTDQLEDATGKKSVWNKGKEVWCKLDAETALVKRSISGVRVQYVWMLSKSGKSLCLVPLENARVSVALYEKVDGKRVKAHLDGEQLNSAWSKVKREAARLLEMKKSQAVIVQNNNQAATGWAKYTYRHNPIKIKLDRRTQFVLSRGDKFRIKRTGPDRNIVVFTNDKTHLYTIDDLRLSLLINRSAMWLEGKHESAM